MEQSAGSTFTVGLWKILNRPKEMNAVSKSTAAMFSSSLPICPVYFHLVMPRHVLSPCYAPYEHTNTLGV
jgi:hypothetical protein